MRIAFVAGNQEQMPDPVLPLGVLQVMAATAPEHERTLVDLCFEGEPERALGDALSRFLPDVVAIGMRNVHDNTYGPIDRSIAYYRRLVSVARAHAPRARVVLGGGGYSVLPERLLEALGADVGVAGEGELVFARLLEALAANAPLASVPGVFYREGSRVLASRARPPFVRLDETPPVDRAIVDRRYYERCGTDSIQTKRGCPMRCAYCTYPTIEGSSHRLRDPERVADEFERAHAAGARHVFIVDAVFNLPPRHARLVAEALARRGTSLPWTSYVNPIRFEPELAEAMARGGAVGMEMGSDSGDDEVLRRLQKGFDTEAIRRASRVAKAAGLKDCHTFLLGTEGESLDTVRRTLDFVVELDPFAAILMVWNDEHEALDPALAERRRALREQILELVRSEHARYPRWVVPQLEIRFRRRTFALLRRRGLAGPLWQHLDKLGAEASPG